MTTDKDRRLDLLENSYQRFRLQIVDLPGSAYDEKWLGDWNLSQLLAHMSGWWREMTPAFARVAAGERPAPEGVSYANSDEWNEKFAARALPGKESLAEWDAAYRAYRDAAESLPADFYGIDPEKNRPRIGDRLLEASGIGHFAEHQPQLDQWLASREQ